MRTIFIDLEMNPVDRKLYPEVRRILGMEVIEFGAVALDEEMTEVASLREFVKPQFNDRVPGKYRELTGIGMNRLASGVTYQEALEEFAAWCHGVDPDGEFTVYAWSESDLTQIIKECHAKDIEVSDAMTDVIRRWKDYQAIFMNMVDLTRAISLEHALDYAGIGFEGKMHDALYDARNTANLYRESSDVNEFRRIRDSIRTCLGDSEHCATSSLGSLFDFGKLMANAS